MAWGAFLLLGGGIAIVAILPLFLIFITMIIGFIRVFIIEYFGKKGK